jgi:hypothetical protein
VHRRLAALARWGGLLAALAVLGAMASGCTLSSAASKSIELGADSDQAVIVFGTSVDRNRIAPEDDWSDQPPSLLTHWQQYDPNTMRLVSDGQLVSSLRDDSIWSSTRHSDAVIHVLEVEPGDYALVAASIFRTITTFVPLTGSNLKRHNNPLFPLINDIEMEGEVAAKHNFLFSVRPGQVVYIGHFDFVHEGGGKHRIVDVRYSQDEAAARAALKVYPGITAEIVTLNLALPTEQAAR